MSVTRYQVIQNHISKDSCHHFSVCFSVYTDITDITAGSEMPARQLHYVRSCIDDVIEYVLQMAVRFHDFLLPSLQS
jgi:hypothetical protein